MNRFGRILVGTTAIVVMLALVVVLVTRPKSVEAPVFQAPQVAEISITEDGFVPAAIKIKAGTRVIWKNADNSPHGVASNPFPDNSDLPGLDSRVSIGPSGTYSYQFNNIGTFNYHDELNPKYNGTILVE